MQRDIFKYGSTEWWSMAFSVDWAYVWTVGQPFLLFLGGMVLYALFIYAFYEKVSRKLIFSYEFRDVRGAKHPRLIRFMSVVEYGFKFVFLTPLFLFVWFVIITALLLLMNPDLPLQEGMLLGMSMLATIRIVSYIRSNLAEDLAKILPLAMLALFLVDRNVIVVTDFLQDAKSLPANLGILAVYFGFMVLLELFLRVVDAIINRE